MSFARFTVERLEAVRILPMRNRVTGIPTCPFALLWPNAGGMDKGTDAGAHDDVQARLKAARAAAILKIVNHGYCCKLS